MPGIIVRAVAQPAPVVRGSYLIKNGSVVSVEPALGVLPRADVLVRNGRIEAVGPDLAAGDAEVIDATDMIVMPGFVDTHYHMWSALGRNFIGDGGFGYFPAKNATSTLYQPDDFYNSVMLGLVELANAGITTVHNWSHNTRTPAHADAELRAHREFDAAGPLRLWPHRPHAAQPGARFHRHRPGEAGVFAAGSAFEGLVTFGLNLRGTSQSEAADLSRGHAARLAARPADCAACRPGPAQRHRRRGFRARAAGSARHVLLCHYVPARDIDAEIMARTRTPLSWATHSEFRLGAAGDPRVALLRMRKAGVLVSLSFDATSIAPAQHVRDHAVHLEHGHPVAGHADRRACRRSASAR